MAEKKRSIVCGSGAGGLTMALLLARSGQEVTLIESQPEIGGYLRRFYRNNIPWDTGYHFSGGFGKNDPMTQMMQVLGIENAAKAELIPHYLMLENGFCFKIPSGCGFDGTMQAFCDAFPADADKIREYFRIEKEIWETTPMHDLRDLSPLQPAFSQYDLCTAAEICRDLALSPEAAVGVCSFAMCHGTPLDEAPMTFHARAGYAMHNDLSRPVGGGDTIIREFKKEAEKYGIDIRVNTQLLPFDAPDANGECHLAHLSDGTDIKTDRVFFTIHPFAIQKILPQEALTTSLNRRIRRLKESCSFFCAYFTADELVDDGLASTFSGSDIDKILRGGSPAHSTGILFNRENDRKGRMHQTICAFRTMNFEDLPADFSGQHRERMLDPEYQNFKARITAEIEKEIISIHPHLQGKLRHVTSGTPLTCLDYDPPTGSAYGARCICGQSRVCGQLPVKNFFAAGQSSLVPGVMGTMLASFSVFRQAQGEEVYTKLIREAL